MSTPESKLVNFIDAQVEKRLQKILIDIKGVEFATVLENALRERNRLREQLKCAMAEIERLKSEA